MGVLDRFERKLEGAVHGVFARAFKGDVQPVEIAARLQRELDAEAKLMSRTKKLVPNDFTVILSAHDYDRLVPYGKTLNAEIIPELKDHAKERGYVFNGPIRLNLEVDDSLPTGRFVVESQAVAAVDTDDRADTEMLQAANLVLEVNGMRHPLQPPGFTIGRGSDADLRINDPGISRRHAEIQVHANGLMRVVDLGSTNGIVVNGNRVREANVTDGTRIEIGSTRMLVHAPQGH
ncbi:FhaA domain-containing protein [Propionibacteriaceae bacterium Y2011]|uniref:FhaA domain-containing protein n=1 Tax=Microlunatus sp. Y2014 TaxID=3418488 RepID=UPI003B450D42